MHVSLLSSRKLNTCAPATCAPQALLLTSSDDSEDFDSGSRSPITSGDYSESAPGAASRSCVTTEGGASLGQGEDSEADYHSCVDPRQTGSFITACSRAPRTAATTISFGGAVGGPLDPAAGPASAGQSGGGASEGSVERGHAVLLLQPHTAGLEPLSEEGQQQQQGSASDGQDSGVEGAAEEEDANPEPAATAAGLGDSSSNTNQLSAQASALTAPLGTSSSFAAQMQARLLQQAAQAGLQPKTDRVASAAHTHHHPPVSAAQAQALHPEHEVQQPFGYQAAAQLPALTSVSMPLATAAGPGVRGTQERGPHDAAKSASCSYSDDFELEAAAEAALGSSAGTEGRAAIPVGGSGTGAAGPSSSYNRASGSQQLPPACESSLSSIGSPPAESHILSGHRSYTSSLPPSSTASTYQYPHPDVALARSRSASRAGSNVGSEASCSRRPSGSSSAGGAAGGTATPGTAAGSDAGPAKVSRGSSASGSQAGSHRGSAAGSLAAGNEASSGWASTYSCELFDEGSRSLPGDDDDNEAAEQLEKGGGEQLPGQEEAGPDAGPAQTSASDAATSGESKDLGAGSHEEGHDEEGDEDEEEPPVPASETEAHEVTEEEDFDSHPGSAGVSRSSSMFVRSSGVPNIPGLGFAPGPSILQRALAQAAAGGHSGLPPLPHQVAHHKAAAAAAPGQASSSSIKASSAQSAGASADISAHSVGVSADNSTPSMQSTGAELETGAGVGGVGSRGSSRGGSSRGGSSDGASSIGGASVASAPSASHSSSSSTVSVGSKRSSSSVTRSSGGGSSETGSRNWRAGPRTGGAGSLSSVHSLGSSEEGSSSQGGAGRSKQRVFTNPIALEHDVYAEAPHATARVATPPTVVAAGGLPGGFVFGPKEVEALSLSISFGLAQEPAVVVRVPTIAPAGAKSTGGAQTAGGAHGSAEGPSSSLSEALSGPPSTAPSVGGGSALMDAAQGQEPAQAVLGTSAAAAAEAAPAPTAATGAGPSALDRVLGPPMGPGPVALPPRSSSAGGAYSSGHRRSSSSCPSFASSGGAPPGASGPGSHRSTPPGTPSKQQLQQQLDARRRSTAQRGGSCGGSVLSSSGDTIFSKLEAELDEIERMYIGATVEVEVPAATGQVGEAGAGGSSSKEVMSLPPTNPVPGRSPSRRTSTDAAVAAAAAIAHATLASPRGDIALALSRHTAAGNAVRSQETSPVSAAAAAAAVLNGEGVTGPPSSGAVTGVVEEGQEEAAPTSPLRLLQQQRQRHASPARPVPDSPSSLVELVARIALGEGEGGDEAVSAATALGSGPGSHATPSRTSSSAAAAAAAAMAGGAEAVANVVRPTRTPGTSSKTGQAMTLTELLAQHLAEEAAEEEQQQAAEASLGGAPPAASQPPAVARSLEDSLSMAAAAPLEQGSVLGQGPADTLAAAPDAGVQPGPDGREVLLQQLDLAQAQLQRMLERAAHRRASPEPSPHAAESAAAALLASAQATESQHEAAAAGVGADAQPKAQPRPQRKSEPLVLTRLDAAALHASQSFGVPMPQVPMADEEMSEASLGLYAVNSSASVVNRATTESLQSLPRLSPRDAAVQQQPPEPATVLRPLNALDFGGALLSPKTAVPASGVSSHSRGSSGGSLRSHHSTAAAAQTQPLHTQPSAPAAAPASAPAQHPAPTQAAQAPVAPVQASAEGNKGLQVSQSPAAATAGIVPGTEAVAPERSPSPVATAGAVAHVLLAPQLPMRETQEGEEGYGEGVVTIPAELTESMDRAAAAVDASMEQASSLLKSVLDLMSQPGAATNIPEAQLSAAASALALLQARQAAQASGPVTPSQRTLQAVPLAPAPAQAPAAPEPAAPAAPPAPTINTPAKAQEVARSSRASVHAPATSAAPAVPTTRAPAAPPAAAAPARATAPASQAASVAAALGLPSEGLQAALAALASLPSPHIHPSAWQRIMGPEVHAEAQAAAAQPSATATAHPQAPQTIPVATVSAGAAGEGIGMPAFSAPSPAGGRRYVMPGSAGASTGAASSMPSVPWTPQPQHRGQQPQQPPWAAVSAAPATTGKPSRSTRSILAQLASPKPISSRYRWEPFLCLD